MSDWKEQDPSLLCLEEDLSHAFPQILFEPKQLICRLESVIAIVGNSGKMTKKTCLGVVSAEVASYKYQVVDVYCVVSEELQR
jgi:hypothetical protein